ncbi:MAG: sulfur relay protein DsrC [Candidatus Muproteobacteria bacterium RBG_16_65_31]|uniref:Sulfur relay protein DsrC n=1 Tax=Candidatus Muproteobacteria bacterium RBG_16_65_31 TaxID=1817759 RepID=A0A1F6TAG7_9PROT|nr:MAG: sulfur relay protein DsrC [Candidatus Muproteobacteria bacterium RBG_16_65_31]
MLYLSEILIQNHDLGNFEQLCEVVTRRAQESGEIFFRIDVKPPFPDTPGNWEDRLEGAFVGVHSVTK